MLFIIHNSLFIFIIHYYQGSVICFDSNKNYLNISGSLDLKKKYFIFLKNILDSNFLVTTELVYCHLSKNKQICRTKPQFFSLISQILEEEVLLGYLSKLSWNQNHLSCCLLATLWFKFGLVNENI
jgi:hypothetical protein